MGYFMIGTDQMFSLSLRRWPSNFKWITISSYKPYTNYMFCIQSRSKGSEKSNFLHRKFSSAILRWGCTWMYTSKYNIALISYIIIILFFGRSYLSLSMTTYNSNQQCPAHHKYHVLYSRERWDTYYTQGTFIITGDHTRLLWLKPLIQ